MFASNPFVQALESRRLMSANVTLANPISLPSDSTNPIPAELIVSHNYETASSAPGGGVTPRNICTGTRPAREFESFGQLNSQTE